MKAHALLLIGLVSIATAGTGCIHRRCGSWDKAACQATGEPAVTSPLRIYALGDAGLESPERAQSLQLLHKVIASEGGASTRVLAVLGNNVYDRGMLSNEKAIASAKTFYGELFGATGWSTIAVLPGNEDHGEFRHRGFDAKAIAAESKWFRDIRADVVFPDAADPRVETAWTNFAVKGHEQCLTISGTDSQGYRENLLAQPLPKTEAAWNVAIAHHPTRTAANHMGDRKRPEYGEYARSLEGADLLLAAHENVLFADLATRDEAHPGPPNIVTGSFSRAKRLKAPELTSCAAEQNGFVRVSVVGDSLVADFFALTPGEPLSEKPYCTQTIRKAGSEAKCAVAAPAP